MTYDPGRDPQNPLDVNPRPRTYRETRRSGMSAGAWIGIVAALAVATFLMFSMGRNDEVATFDRPAPNPSATTGSGAVAPAPAIRDRATGANPANTPAAAPASK